MIHVLVSFDANYMQHTQVMLYSLCKHTKESVEVWLLNLKLTDEQCAACKRFLYRKKVRSRTENHRYGSFNVSWYAYLWFFN